MRRIIKWLFYLAVLGIICLTAYTYIGPFFGADFRPTVQEIRHPVVLNAD